MTITVLGEAERHLDEGYQWYEQRDAGTGDYFLHTMYAEIESLRRFAGIHRKVYGQHRLLTGIFPYSIYYTLNDDTITVRAVLDLRRSPAWIRRQLRS